MPISACVEARGPRQQRSSLPNRVMGRCLGLAIVIGCVVAATAPIAQADSSADQASATSAVSAVTPVSAAQLDSFLAAKGSPMAGEGAAFVASGGAWRIDPRLLVAIAGSESSYGQVTCARFNAWGWGCPHDPFAFTSWADAIDTVARGLRENYLDEGRTTVAAIHAKYAPVGASNDPTNLNSNWTMNVSAILVELGGDPLDVDMDGVAGQAPAASAGAAQTAGTASTLDEYGGQPHKAPADALSVAAEAPSRLIVKLTNTGRTPWTPQTVRLSRLDSEDLVSSAPYASLRSNRVEPGEKGVFNVELSTAAQRSGLHAVTKWRLDGPAGQFGPPVRRDVLLELAGFAVSDVRLASHPRADGGSTVVVQMRNGGSRAWHREGDEQVLLGAQETTGPSLASESWLSQDVPAALLQRIVLPGEWGTFAFAAAPGEAATQSRLVLRPFGRDGWAAGKAATVTDGQ